MTQPTTHTQKPCAAAQRLTTTDVVEFYRDLRMTTQAECLRDNHAGVSIAATWAAYRTT
jgi:hypothetical protein